MITAGVLRLFVKIVTSCVEFFLYKYERLSGGLLGIGFAKIRLAVFSRTLFWNLIVLFLLVAGYSFIAFLARGGSEWWYIDFVSGSNIYWGDDGYRFFLSRAVWLNSEIFWFNFFLPLAATLDGLLQFIADSSYELARYLKSIPLAISIILFYHSCRQLGVGVLAAFLSCFVLAFTPLYVFVGLSFYGESWFLFFISLLVFFLAAKRILFAVIVLSLMPFIRPEGLIFIACFSLYFLINQKYKLVLLTFLPGFFYLLLILFYGPGVGAYLSWRGDVVDVYRSVELWYGGDWLKVFDVVDLSITFFALYGAWAKRVAFYWLLLIAVFLIIARVALSLVMNMGSFEPRFLVAYFPIIMIGFAAFLDEVVSSCLIKHVKSIVLAFCVSLAFFMSLNSLDVVDNIRAYFLKNWNLPKEVIQRPFQLSTYFKKADYEEISAQLEYAEVVMKMLEANPQIDTVIVADSRVLYFLDPKRLGDVRVVFALFGWATLKRVSDKFETFGYFPNSPYAGYFQLDYPREGRKMLLYLDDLKMANYPFHWNVRGNHIYLFDSNLIDG